MFAGVGASKLNVAPPGAFEPDPRLDWDTLTFNGEPIAAAYRAIFTYAMTDQGRAEEEAAIEARGGRAVVEFARDAQDKQIDKFADELGSAKSGLVRIADPLRVVMDRHLPKGFRGRWLGSRKTEQSGMIRGVVEYETVRLPNGDPVQLGGMTLGMIPEATALEAQEHYAEIERENRVSVNDKVREHNEKNVGSDLLVRAATRRGRLDDLVGENDDSDRAAADLEREMAAAE